MSEKKTEEMRERERKVGREIYRVSNYNLEREREREKRISLRERKGVKCVKSVRFLSDIFS